MLKLEKRNEFENIDSIDERYKQFVVGELLPILPEDMGVLQVNDAYSAKFENFEIALGTYVYVETGDYALFNVDNIPAKECYAFESTKVGMRLWEGGAQ